MGGTDIDIFLQMTSKLDCLFLSVGEKAKRDAQQGSQNKVSREGEEECNGRNEHSKRKSNCEENEHFLSCSSRTNRISNCTDPPFCISFFIKTPSQYKLASLSRERGRDPRRVAVGPMHACITLPTFWKKYQVSDHALQRWSRFISFSSFRNKCLELEWDHENGSRIKHPAYATCLEQTMKRSGSYFP